MLIEGGLPSGAAPNGGTEEDGVGQATPVLDDLQSIEETAAGLGEALKELQEALKRLRETLEDSVEESVEGDPQ